MSSQYLTDRIENFKTHVEKRVLGEKLNSFKDHPMPDDMYAEIEEEFLTLLSQVKEDLYRLFECKSALDGLENDLDSLDKSVEKVLEYQVLRHIIDADENDIYVDKFHDYIINLTELIKESLE